MRILVLEDNDEKYAAIADRVTAFRGFSATTISRASNLAAATKAIFEEAFDIIVVDLMVPPRDGDLPLDVTEDVIAMLQDAERNAATPVIALSSYDDLVEVQRVRFADAGIALTHFDASSEAWGRQLDAALLRARERIAFDFVIICALDKERAAYTQTPAAVGQLRNIQGLDALEVTIGTLKGVALKLPRMGLVNAAALTARAIELLKPRLIAMSGICAGFSGETKVGALHVAEICWEHQAGKWSDDGFKMEHYDVPLDADVGTVLSQMIAEDRKGSDLKKGLLEDAIVFEEMSIAPFASGSSVIASGERMLEIKSQHRKATGLDMEMYGVYQAARLSHHKPITFGVKAVVDVGDHKKSDAFHEYGCVLSARFVVKAIPALLQ